MILNAASLLAAKCFGLEEAVDFILNKERAVLSRAAFLFCHPDSMLKEIIGVNTSM